MSLGARVRYLSPQFSVILDRKQTTFKTSLKADYVEVFLDGMPGTEYEHSEKQSVSEGKQS